MVKLFQMECPKHGVDLLHYSIHQSVLGINSANRVNRMTVVFLGDNQDNPTVVEGLETIWRRGSFGSVPIIGCAKCSNLIGPGLGSLRMDGQTSCS